MAIEEGVFGDVEVGLHPDNPYCVIIKRPQPEPEPEPEPDAIADEEDVETKNDPSTNADEEQKEAEVHDDYDELIPHSHEGTHVVLQFNGVTNPVGCSSILLISWLNFRPLTVCFGQSTPGPRSKGATQDRIYQIATLTSQGQVAFASLSK